MCYNFPEYDNTFLQWICAHHMLFIINWFQKQDRTKLKGKENMPFKNEVGNNWFYDKKNEVLI